ncbi:hypothetical protein AC1031_020833 [Aphanomyces cochlioides]|nr:hypothetical protein AC1031_020833 [Aphanomyces cochlioides]
MVLLPTTTTTATLNFANFFADLTKIRRHIHTNPELNFQEYTRCKRSSVQISVSGKTGLVVDIFGPQEGPLCGGGGECAWPRWTYGKFDGI